jgi:hypothetical protein
MVDQSSRRRQMPVAVFNARKRANVIFDPSTLPRRRRHAFGKLDRFVAHSGSIGPTKAGWSFGCLCDDGRIEVFPRRRRQAS